MNDIFFTSDTHFGHAKIIEYCKRPFSSVEEMDEILIQNWNKTVSKGDTVYHLGDFCWRKQKSPKWYWDQLNGNKILIKGNHDRHCFKELRFEPDSIMEVKISRMQRLTLCHYPMQSWNASYYGSYHLHGHTHNLDSEYYFNPRLLPSGSRFGLMSQRLNVCVEKTDYRPINLEEVESLIEKQMVEVAKELDDEFEDLGTLIKNTRGDQNDGC